jgi:methylenetetrahydrofolate dehydrogenase (NADP+) / methenyltetrahydrofolate cyclohydrolase
VAATLMDGAALAAKIRTQVAGEAQELGEVGLATVQVGEDEASTIYLRLKHKAAAEVEIASVDHKLPHTMSEDEVLALVGQLNADDAIDGILVQLPLPDHIDEARVIAAVDPVKDVDGFHPFNAGQLYLGRPTHVPATPLGVMALLAEYRIPLDGARAVVVGRSTIVGKPVAHLLLQAHSTVTICHSHTDDLARQTLDADVLVVAAGVPEIVSADMVKSGSTVVDVGINRTDSGVVGDVDPDAASRAAFLTPVPGGVGPMTIALLLENTVRAARYRRGLLAFP